MSQEILDAHNRYRVEVGVPPSPNLVSNPMLSTGVIKSLSN